jgi:hypothetical protein
MPELLEVERTFPLSREEVDNPSEFYQYLMKALDRELEEWEQEAKSIFIASWNLYYCT